MVLQGHRQRRPSVQLNPCTALRMKRRTWSLEQGPVVNKAKYSSMAEYMMGAAGLHQILGKREGKGSQGGLQKEALLESSQEGLPAAALASSAAALGPDPLQSQSSSGSRGTQGRGGKLPPLHATGQQQRTSSPELQIPSWSQAASPVPRRQGLAGLQGYRASCLGTLSLTCLTSTSAWRSSCMPKTRSPSCLAACVSELGESSQFTPDAKVAVHVTVYPLTSRLAVAVLTCLRLAKGNKNQNDEQSEQENDDHDLAFEASLLQNRVHLLLRCCKAT